MGSLGDDILRNRAPAAKKARIIYGTWERAQNNFYNWRPRGWLDLNVLIEEMRRNTA